VVEGQRWISQRLATEVLVDGFDISPRQARQVLAAGLAGEPLRERGFVLYDGDLLLALIGRESATEGLLDAVCPHGLFVARREPGGAGWPALRRGWRFSPWTAVWLKVRIETYGPFPVVATVGGFVVACADMVAASVGGSLALAHPGAWSEQLEDRHLPTGPGRDWWIRGLDKPRGRLPE
jgi:hypothetical protein